MGGTLSWDLAPLRRWTCAKGQGQMVHRGSLRHFLVEGALWTDFPPPLLLGQHARSL